MCKRVGASSIGHRPVIVFEPLTARIDQRTRNDIPGEGLPCEWVDEGRRKRRKVTMSKRHGRDIQESAAELGTFLRSLIVDVEMGAILSIVNMRDYDWAAAEVFAIIIGNSRWPFASAY